MFIREEIQEFKGQDNGLHSCSTLLKKELWTKKINTQKVKKNHETFLHKIRIAFYSMCVESTDQTNYNV